jgi:hypothetical protein
MFCNVTVETWVEMVRHWPVVCLSGMHCPICIVIARNTSILASVISGRGKGLSLSVKVVRVVSVSLYHQQCYNFCNIRKENAKWTGAVVYLFICGTSLSLFPLGPPVKVCTTLLCGPESHCRGDDVWTCWPDPLWKTSSPSEALDEIKRLDAWPLHVGQSGCRCDTPGSSWKPPSPSEMTSLKAPASSLTHILDTDWSFSHTEVLSAVARSHNLKCNSYWSHTSGVVWSTVSRWMPAEMQSRRLGRWQPCHEWLPMLVQSWLDAAGAMSELGTSGTALHHYSFRCWAVGLCGQTLLLLLRTENAYSFLISRRMLFEAWTGRLLHSVPYFLLISDTTLPCLISFNSYKIITEKKKVSFLAITRS